MAAVHAGVKRSYHQMHDSERSSPSPASSRDTSPLRRQSRDVGGAPGLRSGFETPAQSWTELPRKAAFDVDSSLFLVGVRGVGKSSLGILAATAYNRRLVESERAFAEATGTTTQSYRKRHGANEYHRKHEQVLRHTIETHRKNCVIVCSFSDLENHGAALLREYAQSHPVIHITREARGIQSHLRVWSLERVKQLLRASGPLLRSCSNYEFFNLSEKIAEASDQSVQDLTKLHNGLFLTLKRVERDFLKMLRNVIGDHDREQSHHSAYPLSQVPVHKRDSTLSAVVTVDNIINGRVDLDELQVGVDGIELMLPIRNNLDAAPSNADKMEDDLLKAANAFATIRRSTILPIALSLTAHESCTATQKHRAKLMSYCFRLAPEYCAIDLSFGDGELVPLIAAKGRTRVVGMALMKQQPALGWKDEACMTAYRRAGSLDFDLVKITMPATDLQDNFAVQAFRQTVKDEGQGPRLIAYNTGKAGRLSMCFNNVLTPVRVPTSNHDAELQEAGDPVLTAKEMFTSLFASFIYEPMHFFIYGANVSYSLSPAMHKAAYKACGMPHSFGTHSSATLDDFKRLSREPHFGGAAVVQPYKTSVVPLLGGMSSHAKAIGSVNTITPVRKLKADGTIPDELELLSQANQSGPVKTLYGHNTDWIGIRACLRRGLSPANTVRSPTTALVCGAGGQARASVYAMLSLGVRNIFICNRTRANAEVLAEHYNGLIASRAVSELDPSHTEQTRVRVLDSFETAWPKEFRQPSLIVSSIPTQTADGTATNFTIPNDWLKSPNGGVSIEVRSPESFPRLLANHLPARLPANANAHRQANARAGAQRLDLHGRLRYPARAGFCAVRAVHGPQGAEEADAR